MLLIRYIAPNFYRLHVVNLLKAVRYRLRNTQTIVMAGKCTYLQLSLKQS